MSENFDSNESDPPKLSNISLEQGKVLVSRIENCLKGNTNADLFILLDFGAAPLEIIMRELSPDLNLDIQHLRLDRDSVQRLGSFSVKDLQAKIGKSNNVTRSSFPSLNLHRTFFRAVMLGHLPYLTIPEW